MRLQNSLSSSGEGANADDRRRGAMNCRFMQEMRGNLPNKL